MRCQYHEIIDKKARKLLWRQLLMIYAVRNWQKFQHYKDRNPPWIKLHFELLSSEDWVMLDDASRLLAVVCMLVASRNGGCIDTSDKGLAYLKRVAYLNKKPNVKPLIECGFLVPDSDCKQVLADARPETETETETETEGPSSGDVTVAVFEYWKNKTRHKKAKLDAKRKKLISARLKDGYDLDDLKAAVDGCVASPFHQGKNDTGTVHDGIELIFRNADKVDFFAGIKSSSSVNTGGSEAAPVTQEKCGDCDRFKDCNRKPKPDQPACGRFETDPATQLQRIQNRGTK